VRRLAKDVARGTAEAKAAEERAKAAFEEAVAREKDAQDRLAEDIQTREHTIADLESSLRQRQEEASQGWAQVEAEREAKDALARELESHRAEAEQAVMKWKELYDREQARATSATDAIAQAQEAAARKDAEVGTALEQARVEKEAVEARLADRFREIATLSNFLAEKEAAERRFRQQTDWLREAGAVLLNGSSTLKGRLFGLMPAVFQHKRQARVLKRKGLFDAEAYLAAHPDVAADGADPLRHYLEHGMSEGRRRG
jgi:hypothetical protein